MTGWRRNIPRGSACSEILKGRPPKKAIKKIKQIKYILLIISISDGVSYIFKGGQYVPNCQVQNPANYEVIDCDLGGQYRPKYPFQFHIC